VPSTLCTALVALCCCHGEGLYREDERDGPGLFSDDDSGQDDVGFWLREHLVKLCVSVPGVFVVSDHWPLPIDPDEHRLRVTASGNGTPPVVDCTPPPEGHLFLRDARLPAESLAVDRQAFEEAFDAAVDDWSQSWQQQLRQICIGLFQRLSSS